MPDISRITLPSGTTYDIKDAVARQAISAGVAFIVSKDAASTPQGVKWINASSVEVTGTLVASTTTMGSIYLVPASITSQKDVYDEYVTVEDGGSYSWERLGSTDIDLSDLGELAYKDTVTLNKQTATASNVTGATVTNTAVNVTPTTTNLDVVLETTGSKTTANAITGLGNPSTESFVKSYPGATSKLVTTSITPTNGTVSIPNVTGNTSVTATKINSYGTASTWDYTVTNEVLIISGANSTAPTGVDVTASNTTLGTALTAAKVGTATTVATGALNASGTGGSVMTGLGTASTGNAVTGYASPTSSSFVTDVPSYTATLEADSTDSDAVSVMTGVSSAALTSNGVTVTKTDSTVLTNATTITVGTNS